MKPTHPPATGGTYTRPPAKPAAPAAPAPAPVSTPKKSPKE